MANPGFNINFNNKAKTDLGQLKAAAVGARTEVKQLGKEVQQASKGGQQAPQALVNQMREAELRLERAQEAFKRRKESEQEEREGIHTAHDAIRLAGNLQRATALMARIASGQATGTEIIRSVITDEKVVAKAAKMLGASPKTISAITETFLPVAHAALMGWELGSQIREKILEKDIFEDELDRHIASGKASATLRDIVQEEQKDHPFLSFFGLDNAKYKIERIEKFAAGVKDMSAQDITAALTSFERGGEITELGNETESQRAHAKRWEAASDETKALILRNQKGIGNLLRQQIDKSIIEETGKEHHALDAETKNRLAQAVVQDFVKRGILSGGEADEIDKKAKESKEEPWAKRFIKHELELEDQTRFANRGKRIPAGPTD